MNNGRHILLLVFAACFVFAALGRSVALAAPPPGPVIVSLQVKSFTADVVDPVSTGSIVHVLLVGTPNDKAMFSIPNVIDHIDMKETRPGIYSGEHKVTAGTDVNHAAIIGQLSAQDGTRSPFFAAPQTLTIDTVKPKITYKVPAEGDHVDGGQPIIACGFDDGAGTGVNPTTIHMQVDGVSTAGQAVATPRGVTYQPAAPLAAGVHIVELTAADYAGNSISDAWRFAVESGERAGIALSVDRTGILLAGDTLGVVMQAPPGGKARFLVRPMDHVYDMRETQPGRYEGKFTPRAGDSLTGAVIVGSFESGGNRLVATLPRRITVNAGQPAAPTITFPGVLDVLAPWQLEVAGKAGPYALIRCDVSYTSSSPGGVMPFGGGLLSTVTHADGHGEWRTNRFDLKLQPLYAHNGDARVELRVVSVDLAGNESKPQIIRIPFYQ